MILRKTFWCHNIAGHRHAGASAFFAVTIAAVFTMLLAAQMAFAAPSALAAEPGDTPAALTASDTDLENKDSNEEYEGGTIPILRLTFADDVDPETGKVTLTGDEKITLMNESANHEYKASGVTMTLEVPAAYDNPEDGILDGVSGYTGEQNLPLEFIRGRGNSTWRVAKKPYKIKLDKKADLFGLGKNKHWALLANYYDESLSLDRLVGWIGDEMGMPYTPRGVPVDLFMNGKYYGNYLLMEEVRVDESRVDIDEVDSEASDLDSIDITGDYLLGTNRKPNALPYDYFNTPRGTAFSYDTPEYGEPPLTQAQQAQQAYLLAHMSRVEDAVYGENFTNAQGDYVWDLMDMASFADMWWVQEFTANPDAYATPSTYLYKKRDQVADDGTVTTGKLFWGPLWDFDFVWGKLPAEGFDNLQYEWAILLRQDPDYVDLLKERWKVLDGVLEEVTREGGLLDRYAQEMSQSWDADRQRWPQDHPTDWNDESYAATIEELRSHIDARRAWINANLGQLQTVYRTIAFMDGDDVIYKKKVRDGNPLWEDAPAAPEKEGMLFHGWFTKDGVEYIPEEPCLEDVVYYADYYDEATATKATDIFFGQSEVWMRYGSSIAYDLMPADAMDKRVVWTSSDESIVKVNDEGFVYPTVDLSDDQDFAEAIVTAHLVGSGVEKQMRVVVCNPNRITLPRPESVSFDEEVTVEVGEYNQLHYTTEPVPNEINEHFDFSFSVEDDSIAEVTSTGVIVGKAPGTTSVTVMMLNTETYEYDEIATVRVTVNSADPVDPDTPDVSYVFSKGAGGTWTKGSSSGYDLTVNRSAEDEKTFSLFTGIEIDGTVVDAANYTALSGSLNVTLGTKLLEMLSEGTHAVKVNFQDGSANTTLTIKPEAADDGESGSESDSESTSGDSDNDSDSESATGGSASDNSKGSSKSSSNGSSSGNAAAANSSQNTVAKTGDSIPVALLVGLAIASLLAAVVGLLAIRKRRSTH